MIEFDFTRNRMQNQRINCQVCCVLMYDTTTKRQTGKIIPFLCVKSPGNQKRGGRCTVEKHFLTTAGNRTPAVQSAGRCHTD
jgi:hypothetical protein